MSEQGGLTGCATPQHGEKNDNYKKIRGKR